MNLKVGHLVVWASFGNDDLVPDIAQSPAVPAKIRNRPGRDTVEGCNDLGAGYC